MIVQKNKIKKQILDNKKNLCESAEKLTIERLYA